MSVALPVEPLCPSCSTTTTAVPGPAGPAGTNGTNGTDGINAYTTLSVNFTMPAELASATATVVKSSWATVGQIVYVETLGHMQVMAVPLATTVTLKNLKNTAGGVYLGNAAPGVIATVGLKISPAGLQGPAGAASTATLNDLSPTTARGDLIVDDGGGGGSAHDIALNVGSNYKVLTADSALATGLGWKAIDLTGALTSLSGALPVANGGNPAGSTGALQYYTGGVWSTLPKGTALYLLRVNAGGTGLEYVSLDSILPTASIGGLIKYSGATWAAFNKGTALQGLRTNAAGTDLEWAATSGVVLQMVSNSTAVASAASTTIPFDNTIPQSGEGTEVLTVTITPTLNNSRLVIEALVPCSCSTTANIVLALFKDADANAIAAIFQSQAAATYPNQVAITHEQASGSTAAMTFKIRIGTSTGAELGINGTDGGAGVTQMLGGVMKVWLRVTEYMP